VPVSSQWLAFSARDTVLVRDGRQFDAGTDATAETIRPGPSTIAGAVFAAYGQREPAAVRGPVLARSWGDGWMLCFPAPVDLVVPDGQPGRVRRLQPRAAVVFTDLSGSCPQLPDGDGGRLGGWVPAGILGAYLSGELLAPGATAAVERLRPVTPEPLAPERRVGLARTGGRTAAMGLLYAATHLRPWDGWAFLAECGLPTGWDRVPAGPVPLGGRGRLADVGVAGGVTWPPAPAAYPHGRVLVYVATPAIWPGGWRLPLPAGARLVAAAVGDPEPVATASPRLGVRDSRALRWAVPAGSVYLLAFDDPGRAAAWAAGVHGRAYGRPSGDRLGTAGFGVVLTGVGADPASS
jgi:hypothetical protein